MKVIVCRCCGDHIEAAEGAKSVTCPACGTLNTVAADAVGGAPAGARMKVDVCRCCGHHFDVTAGTKIVVCPFCETKNVVVDDAVGKMLRRADELRLNRDYVGAEQSYRCVLNSDPDCHEALIGIVLCRYGVDFVEGKPVPHFLRTALMAENPDFRKACEIAPEAIRQQYQAVARQVDKILEEFRRYTATAKKYDVFLCCKVTNSDGGGYSDDYIRAAHLYQALSRKGCRVFFAPECMCMPGMDYEREILHALSSARTMLLICSEPEYLDSSWVRGEWSRFLEMMDVGQDKRLIPLLYGDMRIEQLPREIILRRLQALDMRAPNAEKALIRVIR